VSAAGGEGAELTIARPGLSLGEDSHVHLDPGQWFTFIGAVDRGFTALGGLLPLGASTVEVVDSRGIGHLAAVGEGAWALVLASVDERNFDPLVVFGDATGAVVHRRAPAPTFEERVAEMLARSSTSAAAFRINITSGQRDTLVGADTPSTPVDATRTVGKHDRGTRDPDRLVLARAPESGGAADIGASKLGGLPDLPPGQGWPAAQSRALAFLAQINLDAVAVDKLPNASWNGLLSIFCAIDPDCGTAGAEVADEEGCRVLHFARDGLTRADWPAALDPACRFEEVAVCCIPAHELTQTAVEPDHQLLGTPTSIQDAILDEIADLHGDGTRGTPARWALLLQLDEDPEVGFEWGDAGRLYICLPESDLAAGLVDRAFALTQSH
jgi:uncharacterized protein YwqG